MTHQVLSHDYQNTGGYCMVSVFALDNQQFVIVSDEYCMLSTVDYISSGESFDESMEVDGVYLDCPLPTPYLELFQHCVIEHIKKQFETFGIHYELPYEMFPRELIGQLPVVDIDLQIRTVGNLFATNGYSVRIADPVNTFLAMLDREG